MTAIIHDRTWLVFLVKTLNEVRMPSELGRTVFDRKGFQEHRGELAEGSEGASVMAGIAIACA